MDINDLFRSCRIGDLQKVKYLVEQKEIELNIRDNWDSTPLYYACLCGHIEVVQFLLENGAKCQSNTFDGERCLYGALTDEIRNLLWNFNVINSKTIRRDTYDEFLRKCYEAMDYSDVKFNVHGEVFKAHRCILSARSAYFKVMLTGNYRNTECIEITQQNVSPDSFTAILRYLYTGYFETNLDKVNEYILAARHFELLQLIIEIDKAIKKSSSYENSKLGVTITKIIIESESTLGLLQMNMATLANHCLPLELKNPILEPRDGISLSQFSDVSLCVDGHLFLCNKVFFCGRSEYFKCLFTDHFYEKKYMNGKAVFELSDITVDVFIPIVRFIYQNTVEELRSSNVYDVMCTADMLILPGLKRSCANFIASELDPYNVVEYLKLSRTLDQPRLEEHCTKFMADNLAQLVEDCEFRELVVSDAEEVKQRHETDSIGVIDDIRFHITRNMQTFTAIENGNAQLAIIDKLLEELELEA